jgi:transcription elongation factor Elf1
MEICDKCDSKKTIPFIHCGECGCALKAKVYSPVIDACPKGKWKVVELKWQSEKDKKRYNDIHIT